MGDDDDQAVLGRFVKGLHQVLLCFRIQGRRRFIENEYLRISQQTARNGDALFLTDRELAAGRRAQFGIVTLRQRSDEIMYACSPCHPGNFRSIRVRLAVADVVEDRIGEKLGLLEHIGDLIAHAVQSKVVYIVAIDAYLPFRCHMETRNKVRKTGFPRSRGTDKCDDLPDLGVKVHFLKRPSAIRVNKPHASHGDSVADGWESCSAEVLLRWDIQHGKHAPHACHIVLQPQPQ